VPVHDLAVKEGDLVAATHGRSFWILDDVSPLRQMTPQVASAPAHLFKPSDAYRVSWSAGFNSGDVTAHPQGKNPSSGALVYFALKQPAKEVTLEFLDAKGQLIRKFTSKLDSAGIADSLHADSLKRARTDSLKKAGVSPDTAAQQEAKGEESEEEEEGPRRPPRPPRVPNKAGLNVFAWDLRYPDAISFTNMILWAGGTKGPMALPGSYTVRMTADGVSQTQTFAIKKDPRIPASPQELAAQFALLMKIRDTVSAANNAVRTIRNVKYQIAQRKKNAPAPFAAEADRFTQRLSAIESEIYQVKNQSSQDPLNYPIKLNNQLSALAGVVASAGGRPTAQSYAVFDELSAKLDKHLAALKTEMTMGLPKLNAMLKEAGLAAIVPSTTELEPVKRAAGGAGDEREDEEGRER
jgi:hypothetical protein